MQSQRLGTPQAAARRVMLKASNVSQTQTHYAAEDTARKVAAVREHLQHRGTSKHSHRPNLQQQRQQAQLAELQQQRALQLPPSPALQQEQPQHLWQQQQQDRFPLSMHSDSTWQQNVTQHQSYHHLQSQQSWQHQLLQHQQHQALQLQQEHPGRQQQEYPSADSAQPPFLQLLHGCDMLSRSHSLIEWRKAAHLLQQHVVPAVSSPLQSQQVWGVMLRLAARRLDSATASQLGKAVVDLVKVSLANNDRSTLQRLVACKGRFHLSARQLHDCITAAAAAGADTQSLTSLLDLAPHNQLATRAYFAAITTCINRHQYSEALQCVNRLQDTGLPLSPALQRLQQQVKDQVAAGAAAAVSRHYQVSGQ